MSASSTASWESQSFAIADPGGLHKIYLVFRSVAGGATGNNLFNLNWTEFVGPGVGVTP